jgi:hypothetical protein
VLEMRLHLLVLMVAVVVSENRRKFAGDEVLRAKWLSPSASWTR